jgi:hypothetical protein
MHKETRAGRSLTKKKIPVPRLSQPKMTPSTNQPNFFAAPQAPPEAKIEHVNVFYSNLHHICNIREGLATKKGDFG